MHFMTTQDSAVRPPRSGARTAGLFYLATIVAGLYAQLGTRSPLVMRDDATATLSNITAHLTLYRSGIVADLVMLGCYLVVTVLFYHLFWGGGMRVSGIAAVFSLTGIAVLAMTTLLHVAPLVLNDMGQSASTVLVALRLHGQGYAISLVFFGIYCLLIGWLSVRSGAVPIVVGALMALGGAVHVLNNLLGFAHPAWVSAVPRTVLMLPLLGEAGIAFWLLVFGVRRSGAAAEA